MSLQFNIPSQGGLIGVWHSFTGRAQRRAAQPPPAEARRDPPAARTIAPERVVRRWAVTAEALADSFITDLGAGDFIYRELKNRFDEFCEEAEVAAISDQRFARWLQAYGGVRRRARHCNVTMYKFERRRRFAAAH